MKSTPLSDSEWESLDDLMMNLEVGAGDPPGGWFEILPDQVHAIEAVVDRLGIDDDGDRITVLETLLAELVDFDPCQYDHNGLCQAHSLHAKPCPHQQAKEYFQQFAEIEQQSSTAVTGGEN